MSEWDSNMMLKFYGVRPLYFGKTWPDLPRQLARLYRDRVEEIPWIPKDWDSMVTQGALHVANSRASDGVFYVPAPSTANYTDPQTGKGGYGAQFLDTPEKKKWWDEFSAMINKAVVAYAAYKADEGRKEIERAYNNIALWDGAIAIANLAAAPVNLIKDVAQTYQKFQGASHTIMVLGGVAVLLYLTLRNR